MKKRMVIAGSIFLLIVIAVAIYIAHTSLNGEVTDGYLVKSDFSDMKDSRLEFKRNQNKLLIPIEMEKTGHIIYYVEGALPGRVVLEKQTKEDEWEEVMDSGKKRDCYGLLAYVEAGTYRIKAGPYSESVYLEYLKDYRDEPATNREQAKLCKLNDIESNSFSINETDSHWYKIKVTEKSERIITIFSGLNWTKFKFQMKLFDEDGNLLCEETLYDDLNPNENPEKDIKRTFEPGTYYLEFSKMKEKSGGEYGLYYHTVD